MDTVHRFLTVYCFICKTACGRTVLVVLERLGVAPDEGVLALVAGRDHPEEVRAANLGVFLLE